MTPSERQKRSDEDQKAAQPAKLDSGEEERAASDFVFKILPADPKSNSTDFEDVADK